MALARFVQSMPQMSWMCKKIRKVQRKTAYYQCSRSCWEIAILRCQLPILTSPAFHQSKAGTELLFRCADVRPRNLTTALKRSVTHSMFSSVPATKTVCACWEFAVTGNEQTAGQQIHGLQYAGLRVGNSNIYCFLLSLKASRSCYGTEGVRQEWYKDLVLAILGSENCCHSILAKIFATTPLENKKKKKEKKRKQYSLIYLDSAICVATSWNKFCKGVVCPLRSL